MAEPQQAPAVDPVAEILRSVPVPNDVRQRAWSIYDSARDADDLAAQLQDVPLARSVKQQLWTLKEASTTQPHDIALTIGAPPPSPILAPNPLSWRLGAVAPVGMGNTSDAPDASAGRVATLAGALEHAALPDSGMDLVGLILQGEAGGALMDKVVAPAVGGIVKYGGATVDLLKNLLPLRTRVALSVLRDLNPSTWNSPLTVAGREARASTKLARDVAAQVQPYMPNRGGSTFLQSYHAPEGPLPTSSLADVDPFMPNRGGVPDAGLPPNLDLLQPSLDRFMPNRGGVPDAGVPPGPLPQGSLDRTMPNRGGVPDGGVPPGPLPQPTTWSIDHVMPNRSGVPTTAPGAEPRLTEQQLVQLLREHDAAVAGTAVPKAKPTPAAPPADAVPRPKFTVQDVKAIKDLITKGATQDEAVVAVIKLRGYPKAWQQFAISRVLRPNK